MPTSQEHLVPLMRKQDAVCIVTLSKKAAGVLLYGRAAHSLVECLWQTAQP